MRYYAFFRSFPSRRRDLPKRRWSSSLLACVFLVHAAVAGAQETTPDGEYTAVFKGKVHYTDRQPAEQEIVERTTLRISTEGDKTTILVGQIGSAMSATRFEARSGNGKFVAVHSHPGRENQATILWAESPSRHVLKGTLLYPRVADGLVPGYTELQFEAKASASGPRDRMPASRSPAGLSSASDLKRRFPAPASTSADSGASDARPPKELKPRQPAASTGSSVISGTITGDTGVVRDIQLVDEDENTLQTTTLDRNGRYRFENVAAGRYWIYVNDGRAEAYITTSSGDRSVTADGRKSYQIDFNVRN